MLPSQTMLQSPQSTRGANVHPRHSNETDELTRKSRRAVGILHSPERNDFERAKCRKD